MKIPVLWLISLLFGSLVALGQPLPVSESEPAAATGRTIFVVFTQSSDDEVLLWQLGNPEEPAGVEMTTRNLRDARDSSVLHLPPVPQLTGLRTYVEDIPSELTLRTNQENVDLHEVLSYPTVLTPTERQLTESYLAIKYGITLDQTVPRHYLAQRADGTVYRVWNATADRSFRHRISGLGIDGGANLVCTRDCATVPPQPLELIWRSPTDTVTAAYLLSADDNAPTARTPSAATASLVPLQRRWRVQATGKIPPTEIRLHPDQLFARAQDGEEWVLLLQHESGDTIALPAERAADGFLGWKDLHFAGVTYLQLGLRCPQDDCQGGGEINKNDFLRFAELSPNPVATGNPVRVRLVTERAVALLAELTGPSGRELARWSLPPNTHHNFTFPTALSSGLYYLRVRAAFGTTTYHTFPFIVR